MKAYTFDIKYVYLCNFVFEKIHFSLTYLHFFNFSSDCDCNVNRRPWTTNVQLVTPTASSNSFFSKTEKPAYTQKTATPGTNRFTTANTPFRHTQSKSEASTEYIASAEAQDIDPTIGPFFTTKEEPLITTTTHTTTKSKVIHGKIPWNRLFNSREREKIQSKLNKTLIQPKTTVQPVSVTTPPADVTTTMTTLQGIFWTLPLFKNINSKESSLDDYEGLTSGDFDFTTLGPELYRPTTDLRLYSSSYNTAKTQTEVKILPTPPTIDQHLLNNPDGVITSGSGNFFDNQLVISQSFEGRRKQQRQRKKPLGGRRLFKRPTFPNVISETSGVSTTEVTTKKNANDGTTPSVSFYSPIYTTPKPRHTTTLIPNTSKQLYMVDKTKKSKTRTQIQRNNSDTIRKSLLKTIKPIVESSKTNGNEEKGLIFDTMTISEGDYDVHPPNKKVFHKSIPDPRNRLMDNEATTARAAPLKPTTAPMRSKPRIIGGNAASFTVLSNSDAFLPCDAVGKPHPLITWKYFSPVTGTFSFFLFYWHKNKDYNVNLSFLEIYCICLLRLVNTTDFSSNLVLNLK